MTTQGALIVAVLALSVLLVFALYVAGRLLNEVVYLHDDVQAGHDTDHAKCIAAVMHYVGNEWAAQVLDIAAADYASVESQADKDRIGRLLWREGGDPVPTIWLRERATRLRIEADLGSAVEHASNIDYNEVAL